MTRFNLPHGGGLRYPSTINGSLKSQTSSFPSGRPVVVFIYRCFWHRHLDPNRKLAWLPKSRADFWVPKLEDNALRAG